MNGPHFFGGVIYYKEEEKKKKKVVLSWLDKVELAYKWSGKRTVLYTWAKIIFAGKLRNPSFCHIVGVERPNYILKTDRYWLDLGFKIGLNEKLSICKETSENVF